MRPRPIMSIVDQHFLAILSKCSRDEVSPQTDHEDALPRGVVPFPPELFEDPSMSPIRRLLHPTDFSRPSDEALQFTEQMAMGEGATLVVFHVLRAAEPPQWLYDRMPGAFPWTVDCHHALEERVRELRQARPDLTIEIQVVEGDPAVEILRAAESMECDLIVMGSHGRTGPDGEPLGGVAEAVLRKASCSVLTVKNPRIFKKQRDRADGDCAPASSGLA